ncbi:MAG: helix-hairpin-helix domain-containing protein [Candidatus Erginobacter occultus]|nr:helix-hairpin-helix domain-containing protein [Candidatus Erginobacter occultus]
MKSGIFCLTVSSILLLLAGCAVNQSPAYYRSQTLDPETFKLGDTFIKPPTLWKSYGFQLERIPQAARLKIGIYHQGATELPRVLVNGAEAGVLSPRWADLSSRDYEIFFFDQGDGYSQAFDYKDWTTADCWISPDLLKIGENKLLIITARATTGQADDVEMRNIEIEFRYLDRDDQVTDLRRQSRRLPLPYIDRPDPGFGHHPDQPAALVNLNAAGPDQLMRLEGMEVRTAVCLVNERLENGPFTNLDDVANRVEGIGPDQIKKWEPMAFCGDPEGEPTAGAVEYGILRELKAIRGILEKERQSAPAGGSREERGPNREALAEITLPDQPTADQVRQYVKAIIEVSRDQRSRSGNDPQIDMLIRVGPEHLNILLEFLRREPSQSFYLEQVINRMAGPEHKEIILQVLLENSELIKAVVTNGWIEEARPTLLEGLRASPSHLPTEWIKTVASFKDPDTYDDLKKYFIYSGSNSTVYDALKDLPGIDLTDAVEKAWRRAKYSHQFSTQAMIPIALEFGHPDALEMVVRELDQPSNMRFWDARDLLLKFTAAGGSNEEIRDWYEENKDRIVFDPGQHRFVIVEEAPAEANDPAAPGAEDLQPTEAAPEATGENIEDTSNPPGSEESPEEPEPASPEINKNNS